MPKLTPKITSPVTAIRLKHDVIAERWRLLLEHAVEIDLPE